eukprot:5146692-Amphidinium_carterae.1
MACGDVVWAMPPNPPHSNCLAFEHLLHLALWHRHAVLVCEEDSSARGKHEEDSSTRGKRAKFGLQHGCIVSFGIAVEQLAMSRSD